MAISKLILNNEIQMDVTGTTAVISDVAQGKKFILADGTEGTGTGTGGTTTPYYMWKDSTGSVHFTDTSPNTGYRINVSSVEDARSWTTIYSIDISSWQKIDNCYVFETTLQTPILYIEDGEDCRIIYDGVPYVFTFDANVGYVGTDLSNWDGVSPTDYPFGFLYEKDDTEYISLCVKTDTTHNFVFQKVTVLSE